MNTYCDKMGSRGRVSFAVLIASDGAVTAFLGASIPGLVAVTGKEYKKDGKWSNTTYRFALVEGVRVITGHAGFESGLLPDGVARATNQACDSWAGLAAAMGADPASVETWLRAIAPRSAGVLDERAAALAAL